MVQVVLWFVLLSSSSGSQATCAVCSCMTHPFSLNSTCFLFTTKLQKKDAGTRRQDHEPCFSNDSPSGRASSTNLHHLTSHVDENVDDSCRFCCRHHLENALRSTHLLQRCTSQMGSIRRYDHGAPPVCHQRVKQLVAMRWPEIPPRSSRVFGEERAFLRVKMIQLHLESIFSQESVFSTCFFNHHFVLV